MSENHNKVATYSYKTFVVRLYFEQHTKWWFYQVHHRAFLPPPDLEWSEPFEHEGEAKEMAEFLVDEILEDMAKVKL